MTDKSAEILTQAINDMRSLEINDVEISINLLGAAVPVMIEATGVAGTAKFLRDMADQVEQHTDQLTTLN